MTEVNLKKLLSFQEPSLPEKEVKLRYTKRDKVEL